MSVCVYCKRGFSHTPHLTMFCGEDCYNDYGSHDEGVVKQDCTCCWCQIGSCAHFAEHRNRRRSEKLRELYDRSQCNPTQGIYDMTCLKCGENYCEKHFNPNSNMENENDLCYKCEGNGNWCIKCLKPNLIETKFKGKKCEKCIRREEEALIDAKIGLAKERERSKGNQQVFPDDYYR